MRLAPHQLCVLALFVAPLTMLRWIVHEAALLELALVQWAMHRAVEHGFTPVLCPDLVQASVVEGCGFQPRDEASQVPKCCHAKPPL